eukprot:6351108-Amphidinium_carterae.1
MQKPLRVTDRAPMDTSVTVGITTAASEAPSVAIGPTTSPPAASKVNRIGKHSCLIVEGGTHMACRDCK